MVKTSQIELISFKERFQDLEKEFEKAKRIQYQVSSHKESILNYGNSCPDTSQTDKSGSEISKKLIASRHPICEGPSIRELRNHSHSIHSGRYKQVC